MITKINSSWKHFFMGHGIFHSTFYCTLKLSWVGYDLLLQIEVKALSRRNDSTELDETGEDETVADETVADETGVDELGINQNSLER